MKPVILEKNNIYYFNQVISYFETEVLVLIIHPVEVYTEHKENKEQNLGLSTQICLPLY